MTKAHVVTAIVSALFIAAATSISAGTVDRIARTHAPYTAKRCTERQQRCLLAAARLECGEGLLKSSEYWVAESKSGLGSPGLIRHFHLGIKEPVDRRDSKVRYTAWLRPVPEESFDDTNMFYVNRDFTIRAMGNL